MVPTHNTATIEIHPTHWATLSPVVPHVQEFLRRRVLEFQAGGPHGLTIETVTSGQFSDRIFCKWYDEPEDRIVRDEVLVMPVGVVCDVVPLLQKQGYTVTVTDHRTNSCNWIRNPDAWKRLRRPRRDLLETLEHQRAVRAVVGPRLEPIADTVAAVARVYPSARIAVGVTTRKQLWGFRWLLRKRLTTERVGVYSGKKRESARVVVGLLSQLPHDEPGATDVLVLPFGEHALGDHALRELTSARYRRILCFTRTRWSPDESRNWRMLVVAQDVWPAEIQRAPVTVIMLPTHGTRPGLMSDPVDAKRQLYWHNARRNRRITEVAKRIAARKKKAIQAIVGDSQLANPLVTSANDGVMIFVETLEHARPLQALLPGWVVWSANDLDVVQPNIGCGIICTELAAHENVLACGVLIRANGTRWSLGSLNWPCPSDAGDKVLIDFEDGFHAGAACAAQSRAKQYREIGMIIWERTPSRSGTRHKESKGVS